MPPKKSTSNTNKPTPKPVTKTTKLVSTPKPKNSDHKTTKSKVTKATEPLEDEGDEEKVAMKGKTTGRRGRSSGPKITNSSGPDHTKTGMNQSKSNPTIAKLTKENLAAITENANDFIVVHEEEESEVEEKIGKGKGKGGDVVKALLSSEEFVKRAEPIVVRFSRGDGEDGEFLDMVAKAKKMATGSYGWTVSRSAKIALQSLEDMASYSDMKDTEVQMMDVQISLNIIVKNSNSSKSKSSTKRKAKDADSQERNHSEDPTNDEDDDDDEVEDSKMEGEQGTKPSSKKAKKSKDEPKPAGRGRGRPSKATLVDDGSEKRGKGVPEVILKKTKSKSKTGDKA